MIQKLEKGVFFWSSSQTLPLSSITLKSGVNSEVIKADNVMNLQFIFVLMYFVELLFS